MSPKRKKKPESRAARPRVASQKTSPAWLPLALVLAAATAIHAAILRAPFFADDYLFLDQVRARPLFDALRSRDPLGNFLRPVGRQLHFWIWSHATGESPLAFHAVNLILFLAAVVLLYEIARRLAGRGPAIVAAAFLALSYAADVPLLWASGSQDLLALAFGLLAILLAMDDRNRAAALAFVVAVLSKETAACVPLLCFLAGRRPGESPAQTLRRQWPILAALTFWAGWWLATLALRHGSAVAKPSATGALATLVHLVQVALGLEWRPEDPLPVLSHPEVWIALGAAGVAAWMGTQPSAPSKRIWIVGGALAVLGALPVIAVASIWSAYFYLLAMAGIGLLLGAAVGRSPALAAATVVLLGLASANARLTAEFATDERPWTRLSHVNRHYLERAMNKISVYLAEMKDQEPTLAPNSTIFFGNIPAFLGWQSGDGSLVRWAYRDSSLRGYYVSGFTKQHVDRGPYTFFVIRNDNLVEIPSKAAMIQDLWYTSFLMQDWPRAKDVLEIAIPLDPHPAFQRYWLAWTDYALGDTALAFRELVPFHVTLSRGPSPELPEIRSRFAAKDTLGGLQLLAAAVPRHALDPEVHALLSDAMITQRDGLLVSGLEGSLTAVLGPERPSAWRRLAILQAYGNGPYQAKASIDRYFALGGQAALADSGAIAVRNLVESALPGGALLQKAIRR